MQIVMMNIINDSTLSNHKISADIPCVRGNWEQAPNMGSNHSDLWISAIKEVLAEEGKPPLTASEEEDVRVDVEKMKASRDLQLSRIERSSD
jgi:hypothetical protein